MAVNGGGGCIVLRELTAPTPVQADFSLKGFYFLHCLDGSVCLTESPVKRNLLMLYCTCTGYPKRKGLAAFLWEYPLTLWAELAIQFPLFSLLWYS